MPLPVLPVHRPCPEASTTAPVNGAVQDTGFVPATRHLTRMAGR